VSTAFKLVTKEQNTLNFLTGNASPNNLVETKLEKIWFLLKEIPGLR